MISLTEAARFSAAELIALVNNDAKSSATTGENAQEQQERYVTYMLLYFHAAYRSLKSLRIREAFDLHRRAKLWQHEIIIVLSQ